MRNVAAGAACLGLLIAGIVAMALPFASKRADGQEAPKVVESPKQPLRAGEAAGKADDKEGDDEDGKLYLWGQPEKGTQSMILLRAIDGDRVEAAMLVPVVVHLTYKGAKATPDQIEEAAGGKLLPFELKGRDRFGRLTGDVYLGKGQGWLTDAAPKVKTKDGK